MSQISAKEPGNLHLGRAVTGLGRSMYQRGHRVVSARGFTRTAGRVGRARVQGPSCSQDARWCPRTQ